MRVPDVGEDGLLAAIRLVGTGSRLARSLGIDSNEVLAFCDMPNDLSMLAWAGRSVAMENAHQAVLGAATEVTASNEGDGAALVLEELLAMDYAQR